jgi:hypothetical protein
MAEQFKDQGGAAPMDPSPCFRLLDEQGNQTLALWGQDRLWLFAREIQRHLNRGQTTIN